MSISAHRIAVPQLAIPRMVVALWVLHLAISLAIAFYLQANPELPEAPWFSASDWASNLTHWDMVWEMRIADQGYGPNFWPQTSSKFPLAALLTRIQHQLLGLPTPIGLFIVNKVGLLAGLWALWRLVASLYDSSTADRAVCYMACPIFGTSFIYWMSYPDTLFLASWALAFLALFSGQTYRAGLWSTLAVWTRPPAALLLPVFALSIFVASVKSIGVRATCLSRTFWHHVFSACLLPSIALIAWVIRVSDVTGIPFSPYLAQRDVRQTGLIWPWQRIIERIQLMLETIQSLDMGKWLEAWQLLFIIVTLVILVVLYWRGRLRWELLLFTMMSIFLPLMTGIFAIGRFATLTWLPLAFVYVVPANRRWFDRALWIVGITISLLIFILINIYSLQIGYIP